MHTRVLHFAAVLLLLGAPGVLAQENTQDTVEWLQRRLDTASLVAKSIAPTIGASTPGKQVETPSIADTSMSLVDQTGAPDLIGIAMQFFNLAKEREGSPASITLSAFALRTALLGTDPSRPEVYAAGRNWRRVSVTFGRQGADATSGESEAQVFGVKVLAWDRRDPTRDDNVEALQKAVREGSTTTQEMALALEEVVMEIAKRLAPRFKEPDLQKFLEDRLGRTTHAETLKALTDDDLAAIDALLVERVAPLIVRQRGVQEKQIKALKQAPQLSLSYQAKLRDDDGTDEQVWQGIFDWGVLNRMNISVNGGLARASRPNVAPTVGGRLSFEAQFQLTGGGSTLGALTAARPPLTLSASYAGVWQDDDLLQEDTHKFQTKLTIPLPSLLKGLSLPVSLTVASRPDLIDEKDVRGQVGFTIDFSKFQQALRTVAR
jgi:hypothetical protein